jgi:hypothetical protein
MVVIGRKDHMVTNTLVVLVSWRSGLGIALAVTKRDSAIVFADRQQKLFKSSPFPRRQRMK